MSLGLGGCFHHRQAVATEPLPPVSQPPLNDGNGHALTQFEPSLIWTSSATNVTAVNRSHLQPFLHFSSLRRKGHGYPGFSQVEHQGVDLGEPPSARAEISGSGTSRDAYAGGEHVRF